MTKVRVFFPKDDEEVVSIVREAMEFAKQGDADSDNAALEPEKVGVLEKGVELDELVNLSGDEVGTGE